jgi:hypothetical protein
MSTDFRLLEDGTDQRLTESGDFRVLESSTPSVDAGSVHLSVHPLAAAPIIDTGTAHITLHVPPVRVLRAGVVHITVHPVTASVGRIHGAHIGPIWTVHGGELTYDQTVLGAMIPWGLVVNGGRFTTTDAGGSPIVPTPIEWQVSTRAAPMTSLVELTPEIVAGDPQGIFDYQWDDPLNEIGAWSFSIQNDDPDIDELVDDRLVTAFVDGEAAFQGIVGPSNRHTVADPPGEFSTYSGPQNTAILADTTIPSTLGDDALPLEDVRAFGAMSPGFDDSGWGAPKKLATHTEISTYYTGNPVGSLYDPAQWIGPPEGSQDDAPQGVMHIRVAPVVSGGKYVLFTTADDQVDAWVQNILMLSTDKTWGIEFWRKLHRVVFDATVGPLQLYFKVTNNAPTVVGANPMALIWWLYEADDAGNPLPGGLVAHSDTNCKALAYPAVAPGYTIGKAALEVLPSGITADFDAHVDSNGTPWATPAELVARVGDDSFWAWLQSLADLDIDYELTPQHHLRLYQLGGMGDASGVTWSAAVDADESQVGALDHQRQPSTVTKLVVRWARGRFTVDSGVTPEKERPYNIPHVQSRAAALRLAEKELERLSPARVQASGTIEPTGDDKPYVNVRKGDTVTLSPNESGGASLERVVGFAVESDDLGRPIWKPRLRNKLIDVADRMARIFMRMTPGALGGESAATSTPNPIGVLVSVVEPRILTHSFDVPVEGTETGEEPQRGLTGIINRYTVQVTRESAGSGDTTVTLRFNGSDLISVTVPTTEAVRSVSIPVGMILDGNDDYFTSRIDAADVGVTGIVCKVEVI